MVAVLLLEDERHVRRALARSLEAWGHAVTEVDTVELALVALNDARFDLLVLDVNLPDATGWDVLRAQQAAGQRSPPVVVISAIPPSPARIHEFHPLGVLHKPFPIESLRRLVERVAPSSSGSSDPDTSIASNGATVRQYPQET